MPGPPQFGGAPITNIRNVKSAHWRRWLRPENRCLVPWTSFCEYADTKPKKTPTWFAFDDTRPLAVFAGVWTAWHGTRGTKSNPVEGKQQLFGFLTTDANAEVGAIHPKAMPVILTTPEEIEAWKPPKTRTQRQPPVLASHNRAVSQPTTAKPLIGGRCGAGNPSGAGAAGAWSRPFTGA